MISVASTSLEIGEPFYNVLFLILFFFLQYVTYLSDRPPLTKSRTVMVVGACGGFMRQEVDMAGDLKVNNVEPSSPTT